MVLNKTENSRISDIACAGLKTAAIRVPAHKVAKKLLACLNFPLSAPSANPSGRLSPVSAENVNKMLGNNIDFILDGGECEVGIESTVIDISNDIPTILREGFITKEQIEHIIGNVAVATTHSSIKAPGMMYKHYSPTCPIRIGIDNPQPNEALLAFGKNIPRGFSITMNLSQSANLEEAASNLFKFMHILEQQSISGIAVMPIPDKELVNVVVAPVHTVALPPMAAGVAVTVTTVTAAVPQPVE